MAVFRVERNKGYTVMSNHHLRNKKLTLKAKGLLSQMLSLPEDWDYTLAGLSQINRESIDAIRTAVWELEKAGYIKRRQGRDEKGKMTAIEYTIYEQPQPPDDTPPGLDKPTLENPTPGNPILENPTPGNPTTENPMQLNKDIQRTDLPTKEKINTDLQSTHSIPILSPNPSPLEQEAAAPPERKRKEAEAQTAFEIYREIIKDNISYDILMQDMKFDGDRLDEIVDLMLETVCTRRKTIRIAGDDYPAELVKAKFMKLDSEHIRFVLDCMRENTTKIRNIKQYLRAVLFNAPSTIGNYYTSLVAHDMASGALEQYLSKNPKVKEELTNGRSRVLRPGESIRADGKYQYKYHINGKPHFVYSWKLEPTDRLPPGKKPCLSLRELEKQVNSDLDRLMNISDGQMTVCELVDRYLKTKTGVRQSTKQGYVTVQRLLAKEKFGSQKIRSVKTSDAKIFLINLQQEDGKSYSSIHTIRGVLRPAFQMAVDDDVLVKNPFGFQLAGVIVNDSVTREAISKDQMRKFLKFVHDDVVYCKYYEVVYILFHTGMRISEFCGLTLKDIDIENRIVNIDHQLQRTSDMRYIIETTKTDAGTRKIPITEDVADMFRAIIEDRVPPKTEKVIDGYTGFLFYDDDGNPLVAMHWQHRFNHMVGRYNDIYRVQMPNITPHVCRHTYCSNMAKSGMNPKTLQYLMGHSDISVTMNVYTHIELDDAEKELRRMEEFHKAQAELEKKNDAKAVSQKMFKVI